MSPLVLTHSWVWTLLPSRLASPEKDALPLYIPVLWFLFVQISCLVLNNVAKAGRGSLLMKGKEELEVLRDTSKDTMCKKKREKEGLGLPLASFEILFKRNPVC